MIVQGWSMNGVWFISRCYSFYVQSTSNQPHIKNFDLRENLSSFVARPFDDFLDEQTNLLELDFLGKSTRKQTPHSQLLWVHQELVFGLLPQGIQTIIGSIMSNSSRHLSNSYLSIITICIIADITVRHRVKVLIIDSSLHLLQTFLLLLLPAFSGGGQEQNSLLCPLMWAWQLGLKAPPLLCQGGIVNIVKALKILTRGMTASCMLFDITKNARLYT